MTSPLKHAKRFVVKVGSSLVTNQGQGLDRPALARWAAQIAQLRKMNREVVLVSSGAIAEGMQRLGWSRRPHAVNELQAAAAVGQMGLVQVYESCFREHGLLSSQILLTHDDLADRKRYLNARSALRTLLALGVIPVINENDTVATDEIRVGDNDTLGSLVTNLVEADVMIILTDQSGLFSADPRRNPDATLVTEADAGDPALEKMAGGAGSAIGLGGMLTKIAAAQRAARGGAHTVIASGHEPEVLVPFIDDMTQQVSRSLQFFLASGGGREQPNQILVCGGCANIAGVADMISSKVGIPTEIGDPLGQMKIASKAKSQGIRRDATALLTACGLALRSFD